MRKMNYKWRALALLWVAFFLQQGTRQIFGATLTSIQGSLGATAAGIGVVVTVFTFIYGLSVPFAGLAADLFNRKWMVVSGVFVFCLGIFASGFASCLALLVVTYGILNGIGQSFYYPSATSIIGELHKETRATALSILQMGLYVGIIGCSAVSGYLAEGGAEGWRMPFRLFGGIGILWAVVLALGLRGGGCSRKEHKERKVAAAAGSPGVSDNALSEGSKPTIKEALAAFVANPAAILLAAGFGMMVYVDIGFKTWMPSHLAESFGLAKGSAALHAVLWHYIGAFAGVTLGARVSDRLVKSRPSVRMETNIAGLALAALLGTDFYPAKPGAVRGALTAVLRRQTGPENFLPGGWLRVGFNGEQQMLAERYIDYGSVYMCAAVFLPLGLPPSDAFWTEEESDWTQRAAWSGRPARIDHRK